MDTRGKLLVSRSPEAACEFRHGLGLKTSIDAAEPRAFGVLGFRAFGVLGFRVLLETSPTCLSSHIFEYFGFMSSFREGFQVSLHLRPLQPGGG